MFDTTDPTPKTPWRAVGVLKGRLEKENYEVDSKRPHFFLDYRGREYACQPSQKRWEEKRNYTSNEQMYIVYPVTEVVTPYDLLKRKKTVSQRDALCEAKPFLSTLISELKPEISQVVTDRKAAQSIQDPNVLGHLLETREYSKQISQVKAASALIRIVKAAFQGSHGQEAKRLATTSLYLLNSLDNIFFHPNAKNPGLFFFPERGSRCGILLNKMEFSLVGYRENDEFYGDDSREIRYDGDFLLAGDWKPWTNKPTKAFFTSFINEDCQKYVWRGHIGPRRLDIFLDRENPQFSERCLGQGVAKFKPYSNFFQLRHFQQVEAMKDRLRPKKSAA